MTVTTTTASQTFQGNGTATAFPCQFEIIQPTDVNVYFVNPTTGIQTLAVLNSDYTIAGAGGATGFTVNTTAAVPTGTNLYVVRALPLTQLTDFTNQGAFFPTLHEAAFDRLCMMIQQVANYSEGLNITMSPGLVPQPSTLFPIPQAGSLIGWNAAGNALINTGPSGLGAGNVTDVNISASAGIQSTKLAFTSTRAGAVARTVQAKLMDTVSVKDFGAVGDGVTDDSAAVAAAVAAAIASGPNNPVSIRWPAGSYKVTTGWTQPTWVHHVAEGVVQIDASGTTATGDFIRVQNNTFTAPAIAYSSFGAVFDGGTGVFNFKGPSSTANLTCIAFGNTTNAPTETTDCRDTGLVNVMIEYFGHALDIIPNDFYLAHFHRVTLTNCQRAFSWIGASANSGENIWFTECIFAAAENAITISGGECELNLTGCSFDFNLNCAVYFDTSANWADVTIRGGHMECTASASGVVACAATIGQYCRVLIDNVIILPSTFTAAQDQYGYTFPSVGTRADGNAAFCKFVKQPTSGPYYADVTVAGNTCIETLVTNAYPQASFDSNGAPRVNGLQFKGYPHDLGIALAINENPTFVGGTNGGAVSALQGWNYGGTYTSVTQSSAQTYGGDPVSIAMVGAGSGYEDLVSSKFNAQAGQEFVTGAMVFGGTSTGGAMYSYMRFYDAAGTEITPAGTQVTSSLDSVYTDASQPGYTGNRAHWVRWPFTTVFRAPPGAVQAALDFGSSGVTGTVYVARPIVNRVR